MSAPRLGSFSDAAREAGQQPAQVSAAIKRLETILNIRLFARSTRSLRLTPEGGRLPYATQMLDTLEAGLQKIQTPDDEVRGMLQIAVPSDLGRNLLLTLFRDFRQRPALRLRLLFSDQLTDVFKDPVDVAFRYGNNDDASFISLPVAPEIVGCWWPRLSGSPAMANRRPSRTQPAQCVDLHFARPSVRPLVAEPRRRGSAAEGFRHGDERRRRGDPSAGDRRGGHCL